MKKNSCLKKKIRLDFPISKNLQGQFHLDDILTHPKTRILKDGDRGIEIYAPDGRGAYFRNDGSFRGFIEEIK